MKIHVFVFTLLNVKYAKRKTKCSEDLKYFTQNDIFDNFFFKRERKTQNDNFNFEKCFRQFECKKIKSNASRKVQSIIQGRKNLLHFSFQQKTIITTLFVPK